MCSHNAVAAVHVGIRLDGFGKELVYLAALFAGVQIVIVFLAEMLQTDGYLEEILVEVFPQGEIKIERQLDLI